MRAANEERVDVERLCSGFGVAFRYIGSHAPRESNLSMVSRDRAEQHIHECIVGSPCRFCPARNLGLHAIRLMPQKDYDGGDDRELGDFSERAPQDPRVSSTPTTASSTGITHRYFRAGPDVIRADGHPCAAIVDAGRCWPCRHDNPP
jgi:hypothetical protein